MSGSADDKARLLGTWKLVSAVREEIPSGARTDMFGANPHGFINYSPDGRMIALITRRDRKAPANGRATPAEAEALYRSMLSYGGAFTVEGDVVTHHVDISWNESFTGGTQKRHFKLEQDRLILSTPQSRDPIDGKLSVRQMTWKRFTSR
jgi:Lipocalin-like domain